MTLLDRCRARLAGLDRRVVLPEAHDPRVLQAARRLRDEGVLQPVLIGAAAAVTEAAATAGVVLGDLEIIDPASSPHSDGLAAAYLEARPDSRPGIARRLVRKPLFHAGLMLRSGLVDGMVAGADSPSARVIEAVMMTVGAATGITTPSSCFLMGFEAAEGRPEELLFADCALNIDPDPSQLADIAIASAETWQALQERPARVAFLSFSTHGSGKHPAVDRVVEALAIARIRRPDLLFEGELQADAALSERVARKKLGEVGAVAGRADVLVVPGLEAANIAYKLVQYLAGARATGPLLQGFARPVSDLSRGATADDIVETAILTLARAAHGQPRSATG